MANKLQFLRGPQGNIDELTLDYGQPAFTDAGKFYIGNADGSSKTLINGLSGIPFATFTGTSSTIAVTVTDDFELVDGASVIVLFNSAITLSAPTLNVNSSGAKTIKYAGSAMTRVKANVAYMFAYSAGAWNIVGELDSNTTYGTMNASSMIFSSEPPGANVR